MENLRENKAYRLSLYLLLLIPIFGGVALLLQLVPTNMFPMVTIFTKGPLLGFVSFIFIISIPILFLGALLLRSISLDPFKRWVDFIFILLSVGLGTFVQKFSHTCPAYIELPKYSPKWTWASMFDICNPNNILWEIKVTSIIFIFVSLLLALWFLISDIRRKKTAINTI